MKGTGKPIKKPVKKMGRPTKRPDLETLKFLYEHYTSTELSAMFGVPASTIRSWIYYAKKAGEYIE